MRNYYSSLISISVLTGVQLLGDATYTTPLRYLILIMSRKSTAVRPQPHPLAQRWHLFTFTLWMISRLATRVANAASVLTVQSLQWLILATVSVIVGMMNVIWSRTPDFFIDIIHMPHGTVTTFRNHATRLVRCAKKGKGKAIIVEKGCTEN